MEREYLKGESSGYDDGYEAGFAEAKETLVEIP